MNLQTRTLINGLIMDIRKQYNAPHIVRERAFQDAYQTIMRLHQRGRIDMYECIDTTERIRSILGVNEDA